MKVGKKLRDEGRSIYFAVSDREDFEQQLSDFGVEGAGDKPSITALDANDKKYIMTDVFRYVYLGWVCYNNLFQTELIFGCVEEWGISFENLLVYSPRIVLWL